jgi:D-psicose/D-tagatose/L-ribulose 3-epimerase
MNLFGLHAMVLVSDWDELGAEEAIRSMTELGYDVIEIPLFDPSSVNLERTRALLLQHGLKASVSLGLTPETEISSAGSDISKAGIAQLLKVIDATAQIGGSTVAGLISSAWQKYAAPPNAASYANAVSGIREVAQAAREKSITLTVEVVNRFESNLLNTAAQALWFIDAVGGGQCGHPS